MLPNELTSRKQWVLHREKVPYIAQDLGFEVASTKDPSTWRSFEDASLYHNIGYVFTAEDDLIGIDLDHCVTDGKVHKDALQICRTLQGYTEFSPSKTGLHIIVKGGLGDLSGLNTPEIEIYDKGRYFTMTGDALFTPDTLPDKTAEVLSLYEKHQPAKTPLNPPALIPSGVRNTTLTKEAGVMRRLGWSQALIEAALLERNKVACDPPLSDKEVRGIAAHNARYTAGTGDVLFTTMGEIREHFGSISWAWEDWIPNGHLTMIAGPQAVGKSFFAARLVAAFAGVKDWPDGASSGSSPKKVLVLETEEMRGAWVERLEAFGVPDDACIFGPGGQPTDLPDLEKDFEAVANLIPQEGIGAVIVDSLSAGHMMKENSADMRELLKQYAGLAGDLGIPFLLVHHTRKTQDREGDEMTLDKVRGSNTITQLCRSVIGLHKYDNVENTKAACIKSTFCKPPAAFGFSITGGDLHFGSAPIKPREPSARNDAEDFLSELLSGGPVESKKVKEATEEAGLSWSTVRRAKKALDVGGPRGVWCLPEEFKIIYTEEEGET